MVFNPGVLDTAQELRRTLDELPVKKARAEELIDIMRKGIPGLTDDQLAEVAAFIDVYFGSALYYADILALVGSDPYAYLSGVLNEFLDAASLLVTIPVTESEVEEAEETSDDN